MAGVGSLDTVGGSLLAEPVYRPPAHRVTAVRLLFTVSAFLGAVLLFVVQPLVAKLLLPAYGGSATLWSTSSLFFQVLLLLGYVYVHWSTRRFGSGQPWLHFVLLAVPLLALPLALPSDPAPAADASPVFWLLRTLALAVGLPFAVLATTGPLLQKWFSWTDDPRAGDPYFLFAASNLGSFGGLLAYPLVIEPAMALDAQRTAWSIGCLVFLALIACCAAVALRELRRRSYDPPGRETGELVHRDVLGRRRVAVWLGLAFLPSSLMLGITSHLSTDVAAIPLLWVVPLAIYLATFVVAFGRTARSMPAWATRAAVATCLVTALLAILRTAVPIGFAVSVNLLLLALVGFAAHGRLAADRPHPRQLTHFYVVVAVGGALGGVFNGLVAPLVFDRVLEYQIVLAAVPFLAVGLRLRRPPTGARTRRRWRAVLWLALAGLALAAAVTTALETDEWAGTTLAVIGLLGLGIGWRLSTKGLVLALAIVIVFAAIGVLRPGDVLDRSRSFYGSYRVDASGGQHELVHGTTIHGTQFQDEERRRVPTTYYSRLGPLADVFRELDGGRFDRVGVVGLGTGTIAAYGRPGQHLTFFEIDGEMVRLAKDPHYFSYLADSNARVDVVVGDGRLKLAEQPAGSFDLIILDAFSSDSIPVHLLTAEAMRGYADRLDRDGVLVLHISNRLFDLAPVVAAGAAELDWRAAIGTGRIVTETSSSSRWVMLSPNDALVEELIRQQGWLELGSSRQVRWTDDYSSIWAVLD